MLTETDPLKILWQGNNKFLFSQGYNYGFDYKTGFFIRWGETLQDNPQYSPFGNEILDIEVSTICSRACSWCYKSNTGVGRNMSFETFKAILDKMPSTLTQVAFGIGDVGANPDLWKMMEYCRSKWIVPNVTIHGENVTSEEYDNLAKYCGAVSVSLYDIDTCYNAVKELTDRGMDQVNIHALLSQETFQSCYLTVYDREYDDRLAKLNAVIFLWLKPIGERNKYHQLDSMLDFRNLVEFALRTGHKFGFDSCTAPNFLRAVEGSEDFERYRTMSESCESSIFSYYINVDGFGFPCSFSEAACEGIDVANCNDFLADVWNHPVTLKFREALLKSEDCNGCHACQLYDLEVL